MGSIGQPGAELVVAKTEVFASAASPLTWTDLNLSAIVGAKKAIVFLLIHNTDAASQPIAFRGNGETELGAPSGASSVAAAGTATEIAAGGFGLVIVWTDKNGIVEWQGSISRTAAIDIVAFIS